MWRPLQRHLRRVRTIAFDAPGVGGSDTPSRPMRMRALAAVVGGLLDDLDHRQVDVLGYSFGGAVAQQFAHDFPERVRRLILVATTAGAVSVPGSPRALIHMLSPLRYRSPEYMLRAVPQIAGGRIARDPELLRQHAADRLARPPTIWGYQSQLYAIAGWTSALWLSRLRQPTLILVGEKDPLVPVANAHFLAWRIPNARLHIVRGAGHLLLIDQPDQTANIITDFLADKDPQIPQ
jgi:poly(3-hydroxyalkanoate) depolymerase